jgi:hypothetical protein
MVRIGGRDFCLAVYWIFPKYDIHEGRFRRKRIDNFETLTLTAGQKTD